MKLSLTVEADAVSVLALNMGRISVDIGGIELAGLNDAVCENGYSLRVADEPEIQVAEEQLPGATRLKGIQCSTAHITEADNTLLFMLSHQHEDFGESEWIMYTGSGYLLRLDAWSFPVLRLKRPGLSNACRRLVVTLIRRHAVVMPALKCCQASPLSTGNPPFRDKEHLCRH